jgi:hypothetical protein
MLHFIVPENKIMICCLRKRYVSKDSGTENLIKHEFKMICISQCSFSLTIVWKSVPVMNFNCPSQMNQLHSEIRINISPFCKLKTFTWHIIIIIDTLVSRRGNHEWTTQRHWQQWAHKINKQNHQVLVNMFLPFSNKARDYKAKNILHVIFQSGSLSHLIQTTGVLGSN